MTPPPSRWAASRTTAGGSCPGTSSAACRASVSDGHVHAAEAVERGAVGLLCEHFIPELLEHDVVQTRIAPGTMRPVMARLAAAFYGYPARDLLMIGVTGTNGKTTVTQLLGDLLERDRPAHQRHGHPLGSPDHAGGHRDPTGPGRRARPPEVRRRPPRGGHGGVQPRPRPITGGGHPLRRRRLHQPQPRPPRLPRDHGGVLRGESHAVHPRVMPCAASSTRTIPGGGGSSNGPASRPSPSATATPATSCCGRATPSSPGAANGSRRR